MAHNSIFKDYDIRGIYPGELNEEFAYKLAKAFCAFLEERKLSGSVFVGMDARLSSPLIKEFFIKGVLEQGRDVVDLGLCTAPLFYFSLMKGESAGGAMITASHNPKEYNGFKLALKDGRFLNGEFGLPEIKRLIGKDIPVRKNFGQTISKDWSEEYLNFVVKTLKNFIGESRRKISIAADASNGSSGDLLKRFFEKTGIKYIPLFFEPDGNFPNHSPDPLKKESQESIRKKILEENADFGFIIDGDGDRIVFLDEKGETLRNDIIYAFLLDNLSEKGDKIVFDIRSSKIIEEVARKKNLETKRIRVGRSFIPEIMKKENSRIMAEISGHYYFKEFFYSDSSLMALSYVLGLFLAKNKPFSGLFAPYKKYVNSGEMNFSARGGSALGGKVQNWERLQEKLRETYKDGKQYFIDGFSVEYSDWWFNIRPSKTEPLVRLVIEADNQEILEREKTKLLNILKIL